jgi:3-oxoacyl-[acyl-carrier protein] reductase
VLLRQAGERYSTVDEVAALLAFVASPERAYIIGASPTGHGGTNP